MKLSPSTASLAGRVALVTGASRGIGQAIARRLASAGATVVVSARSLEKSHDGLAGTLAETVKMIAQDGGKAKAIAVACDVEDAKSRAAAIDAVIKQCGRLDILVNNAGRAVHTRIEGFTPEVTLSQVQQYLIGPFELARLAVPQMRKQGGGWIVMLGSDTANFPDGPPWSPYVVDGGAALYSALKASVHRLVINLAAELQRDNIAVNAVAPVGAIMTPGLDALGIMGPGTEQYLEPPEHIAEAALDVASGDPKTKTGVVAFSYKYLDQIKRPTRSLDGKTVTKAR